MDKEFVEKFNAMASVFPESGTSANLSWTGSDGLVHSMSITATTTGDASKSFTVSHSSYKPQQPA